MSIYSIKETDNNFETSVVFYTMLGTESVFDSDGYPVTNDESKAFAKKVYKTQLSYYLMVGFIIQWECFQKDPTINSLLN